jgi:hypothetical protein
MIATTKVGRLGQAEVRVARGTPVRPFFQPRTVVRRSEGDYSPAFDK